MSIGLGHNYLVHVLKHFVGDLDQCFLFMENNRPKDNSTWFELRPLVSIVKGKVITCDVYACDLLEDGKICKK